jgi:hypothetical protein
MDSETTSGLCPISSRSVDRSLNHRSLQRFDSDVHLSVEKPHVEDRHCGM